MKVICLKSKDTECLTSYSATRERCQNCIYYNGVESDDCVVGKDSSVTKRAFDKEFEKEGRERALRYNTGKVKWSLMNYRSMEPMIRVLEYGAKKYAPYNWQKPMNKKEILESMQRHLAALMDGEENDQESGLSHMGHIQANAMFYNYHSLKNERES